MFIAIVNIWAKFIPKIGVVVKSKQNLLTFFSFAYGLEEERKRNSFSRSDIMAPGISYRKSETRWLARLGAGESKRWGKSLR